jgi:uncharacterized protein YcfL
MPILAKSSSGTVTGLWGSAFVRLPSGKLKPLAVGDEVKKGEHIVTTQDGLVQITPPKGGKPVEVKPNLGKPAHTELAGHGDVDKTIAALERGDQDAVTAAGLDGGASGGLLPGLRVDRVVELVTPLEFQYETARAPVGIPLPAGLYFAEAPQGILTPVVPANELPQVSFEKNVSGVEGDFAVFTLKLSKPSATDVVVTLHSENGSAETEDYGSFSGFVVVIPAGETSYDVPVSLFTDALKEAPETFTLKIDSVDTGNATIGKDSAEGTIVDGLPPVQVATVDKASVYEGDDLVFKVSLNRATDESSTLTLKLTSGTATVGQDTALTVKISFDGRPPVEVDVDPATGEFQVDVPVGASSMDVIVPTVKDGVAEINDQGTIVPEDLFLSVTLDPAEPAVVAVGQITDKAVISISDAPVVNEGGFAVFTVTLDHPTTEDVTFTLSSKDGSAKGDADFSGFTLTDVTIKAGETSFELPVRTVNDADRESNENFSVLISDVSANAVIGKESGLGTILDEPVVASVQGSAVDEGQALVFTVALSDKSTQDTPVSLKLFDGTGKVGVDTLNNVLLDLGDGNGFLPVQFADDGTLDVVVPAGSTGLVIKVPTVDDSVFEGVETIKLSASAVGNGSTPVEGTGTILDNEPTPQLSITGPAVVNEAAGTITYTVKLSNPSSTEVTVKYATDNGTAVGGQDGSGDFDTAAGTLRFAPGQLEQTITVKLTDDKVFEGAETFKVVLSEPAGAGLAKPSVTTEIRDDGTGPTPPGTPPTDDRPTVSSISSPKASEGQPLDFVVKLSNATTVDTPLSLKLSDGTAKVSDDTGSPQISFDGGNTFQPITVNPDGTANVVVPANTPADQIVVRVPALNDSISEQGETFQLSAATPQNTAPVSGQGTIDDTTGLPKLSISGPAVVNEAAGTVTYTVKLSNASTSPVSVNYKTVDGGAEAGIDYTTSAGSLTFAPGELSKTITVAIADDKVYEGNEVYQVVLEAPTNATIQTAVAETTIKDDGTGVVPPLDSSPQVSGVSSPSAKEGEPLLFKVDLSNPSSKDQPLTLKVSDGTAKLGTDTSPTLEVDFGDGKGFVPVSVKPDGTINLVVPAGSTGVTLKVPTTPDTIDEPNETIKVTASVPGQLPVESTGTIVDNNDAPKVSISGPAEVNEAAGTVTYTVTLSNPSSSAVSVSYGTTDGTATAGQDFAASKGLVTFAPGETSKTITVSIVDDKPFEGSEDYKVELSSPVGATIDQGAVTTAIRDDGKGDMPNGGTPTDDTPKVTGVSSPATTEGQPVTFKVDLSNPSTKDTTLSLKLTDGTAKVGEDTPLNVEVSFDGGKTYTPATVNPDGTLDVVVPAGSTGVLLKVPTTDDPTVEANEAFKLTASTPSNDGTPVEGTATIVDNDGAPQLSISGPLEVNEAAGTITYKVTLSSASASAVTVDYATADGTAKAGSDFGTKAGTLTFAPGETSKTITVAITEDIVSEGAENYSVGLSNALGAAIAVPVATTTIKDDGTGDMPNGGTPSDDTPQVTGVSSPSAKEGEPLLFKVDLSNPSTKDQPLTLKVSDGTAKLGTDTRPQLEVDFGDGKGFVSVPVKPDGTIDLVVPAGSTSVTLKVPTTADATDEPNETITVTASVPGQQPVESAGTIIDNNEAPKTSISGPAEVNEAAGTVTYTVTLSNPSSNTVSVSYGTADGTATSGQDFAATKGIVTFAPGETSKTITVSIVDDKPFEGAEDYKVELSSPVGATIDQGSVTTSIRDDGKGEMPNGGTPTDDTPKVTGVSSPATTEGQPVTFKVDLSNPSTKDTPLALKLTDGTAKVGVDTPRTVEVSFDGGQTYKTFPVKDDGSLDVTVPPGSTSVLLKVPTTDDPTVEPNEAFKLTASTPGNGNTPLEGTATIVDNDGAPQLSISGPADVNEAAGTVTYTVTLSSPSAAPVTVDYATVNGSATAGSDFATALGSLSFAPGETTKTITVAIKPDAVFEGAETFDLVLSNPSGAAVAVPSVSTTIHDDGTGITIPTDDRPKVSGITGNSVPEGSDLLFKVDLSNPSKTGTPLTLTLTDGTGSVNADTKPKLVEVDFGDGKGFQPVTVKDDGTIEVVVPAGSTGLTLKVPTVVDGISEDAETIKLTAATSNDVLSKEGTSLILDDSKPSLSINDVEVNEAAGTATFTVTLSNPSTSAVTVNYATQDGSGANAATGSATPGVGDYQSTSGVLSFAAGETSKTVTVKINNDGTFEGIENYLVELSNVSTNAQIADGSGLGGINDQGGPVTPPPGPNVPPTTTDDDRPKVAGITGNSVPEGGNLLFKVDLSNPSKTDTPVTLKLTDGTGSVNADTKPTQVEVDFGDGKGFQPVTVKGDGTIDVVVPAGSTGLTLKVPTATDGISEGPETIKLTAATPTDLANAANGTPVKEGTSTILDDSKPSLSINDVEVNEAAGTATFTVTLSNPSTSAVTVNYATKDGTGANAAIGSATPGVGDYQSTNGTLSFAAGETSKTVTVKINNDGTFEGIENYSVELSNPSLNAQIADGLWPGRHQRPGRPCHAATWPERSAHDHGRRPSEGRRHHRQQRARRRQPAVQGGPEQPKQNRHPCHLEAA